MLVDVRSLLAESADVTAIIGSNPVRAFPHGDAPQSQKGAYVTFAVIYAQPENNLSHLPLVDRQTVQVDCWSGTDGAGAAEIYALGRAVRDALEPHGHMTAVIANGRDAETMRYRIGMRFDFWRDREHLTSST